MLFRSIWEVLGDSAIEGDCTAGDSLHLTDRILDLSSNGLPRNLRNESSRVLAVLTDCQHGECVALRGDALCFGLWCAGTRAWWWSTAGGLARPLASNPLVKFMPLFCNILNLIAEIDTKVYASVLQCFRPELKLIVHILS